MHAGATQHLGRRFDYLVPGTSVQSSGGSAMGVMRPGLLQFWGDYQDGVIGSACCDTECALVQLPWLWRLADSAVLHLLWLLRLWLQNAVMHLMSLLRVCLQKTL